MWLPLSFYFDLVKTAKTSFCPYWYALLTVYRLMLKFQCRLVAHWINLLAELVVFESRKYIRRIGNEGFEVRWRHDINFEPIRLGKSVLFQIGSFRINLVHLFGFCRRSGRVVECTGLENRRRWKSTVGSNPTSSATKTHNTLGVGKASKSGAFFIFGL